MSMIRNPFYVPSLDGVEIPEELKPLHALKDELDNLVMFYLHLYDDGFTFANMCKLGEGDGSVGTKGEDISIKELLIRKLRQMDETHKQVSEEIIRFSEINKED